MDYRIKEGYLNQLVAYLKKNSAKGYSMESLKWALVNQGYPKIEVEKAIQATVQELAVQAPKFVEKPVIKVEVEPVAPELSLWEKVKDWFS